MTIEQLEKKEEEEFKKNLIQNDILAKMIVDNIAPMLDSKHKPKSVYELFPSYFEKEIEEIEKERMRRYVEERKAQMLAFAYNHNEKIKK